MLRGKLCTNTTHWWLQSVIPVGCSPCLKLFSPCPLPYQNAWNMTEPASLSDPFSYNVLYVALTMSVATTCGGVKLEQHCLHNTQIECPHTHIYESTHTFVKHAYMHSWLQVPATNMPAYVFLCQCAVCWDYIFLTISPRHILYQLCRKCLQRVEVAP